MKPLSPVERRILQQLLARAEHVGEDDPEDIEAQVREVMEATKDTPPNHRLRERIQRLLGV